MTIEIPAWHRSEIVGIPVSDGVWDVTWLGERMGYLDALPSRPGTAIASSPDHVYGATASRPVRRPGAPEVGR